MRILVGTSGWAYKEWKGSFYPADLPADAMLRHYAGRLPTVEINNSFYRIPKEKVLLDWAEQVPAEFRFVLKASRRITHINRLADEDDSLGYFLRTANVLGEKLGRAHQEPTVAGGVRVSQARRGEPDRAGSGDDLVGEGVNDSCT